MKTPIRGMDTKESYRRRYYRLRAQETRRLALEAREYHAMYYTHKELGEALWLKPMSLRLQAWRAFNDGWKREHIDLLLSGELEQLEKRRQ